MKPRGIFRWNLQRLAEALVVLRLLDLSSLVCRQDEIGADQSVSKLLRQSKSGGIRARAPSGPDSHHDPAQVEAENQADSRVKRTTSGGQFSREGGPVVPTPLVT